MKDQNIRTVRLMLISFTYLLIGAVIFHAIESKEEERHKEALESEFFINSNLVICSEFTQ